MKTLIVVLAAGLALAFVELGLGASPAQAAPNICKYRYAICLARCQAADRRCTRCRQQYRYCIAPYPSMGNLL
jgi:hypothetical protein